MYVFYCIRSSQKIAKLIEEKLLFDYIIEELVMKQIVYVHDLYVNRIKISSISHDVHFLYLSRKLITCCKHLYGGPCLVEKNLSRNVWTKFVDKYCIQILSKFSLSK